MTSNCARRLGLTVPRAGRSHTGGSVALFVPAPVLPPRCSVSPSFASFVHHRLERDFRACGHGCCRQFSTSSSQMAKGAIVGAFADSKGHFLSLTAGGAAVDANESIRGALATAGFAVKEGKAVSLTGVSGCGYEVVSVVGLGEEEKLKKEEEVDENEEIELTAEKVRKAVVAGIADLKAKPFPSSSPLTAIAVDPMTFSSRPSAVGEAVELALYNFDAFKTKKQEDPPKPEVTLLAGSETEEKAFGRGRVLGAAQNLARELMDTPANHMTPTIFADRVESLFRGNDDVTVIVRDQSFAEEHKMGSFISVSRGSAEPLRFVEIHYRGGKLDEEKKPVDPIAFVGKGVTFDTGGISLKPSAGMPDMKADMGGAACVVGAIKGIADLKLSINVMGFIPLCENMPGGRATKPGDVVTAMNGKTIQVDNTDAEGRLILADALFYATSVHKPRFVVDLATLTSAMAIALGGAAAGVFTNSAKHWSLIQAAGVRSGDRVWRMPLWKMFTEHMKKAGVADLNNISSGAHARAAGACTAAGFLREFVDFDSTPHWMHIDIAGVMGAAGAEVPYLPTKGMAGRPVRTLIGFVEAMAEEGEN